MKSEQYFQYAVLKRSYIYVIHRNVPYAIKNALKNQSTFYSQNRWWSGINKQSVFLDFGAYIHTIKYGKLPISLLHTTVLIPLATLPPSSCVSGSVA